MKKFSFIFFSVAISATVFVTSCKKDDDDDNDATANIQVSAPLVDAMYSNGDTVFVNATITAEAAMHGWEIYIRKKDDQTEMYTTEAHDHAATYNISTYWVNNVTQDTEMELEVIATIDHDGTTSNKKVDFHCHL